MSVPLAPSAVLSSLRNVITTITFQTAFKTTVEMYYPAFNTQLWRLYTDFHSFITFMNSHYGPDLHDRDTYKLALLYHTYLENYYNRIDKNVLLTLAHVKNNLEVIIKLNFPEWDWSNSFVNDYNILRNYYYLLP